MSNKLVRSNHPWEEHADNVLAIREMKNEGTSDREICKKLAISHSTLQRYKEYLSASELETLSDDIQNEKRYQLDDQIQSVIKKLTTVENKIEDDHIEYVAMVNKLLEKEDLDDQIKVKLKRYTRFPVGDILELKKLVLQAIDLRTKVWGLDKEQRGADSIQTHRKVTFQINHGVSTGADKLNNIADSIVQNSYGLQKVS
jgi:hypothetical protein